MLLHGHHVSPLATRLQFPSPYVFSQPSKPTSRTPHRSFPSPMHAKGDCQLLPLLPPNSSSSLAPLTSSPCMAFNPDLTCPVSFPLSPLQAVCTKLQSSCTYPAPIHAPVALQPVFIFPIHHQVPYCPSQSPAATTPAYCQPIHLATALAEFICCWPRHPLKSLAIKCHGGKTRRGLETFSAKRKRGQTVFFRSLIES